MMNRTYLSAMLLVVSVAAFAGDNVPAADVNASVSTASETTSAEQVTSTQQPGRITRAVNGLQYAGGKVAEYKKTSGAVATVALVGGGYAARNTRPVQATVLGANLVGNGIASGFNYVVSTRPVQATVSCVRQAGSYVVSKCPTVSRPTVEGTKAIASKVLSTVKNNKQRTAIGTALTVATACAAREVYNYRNNGGTATAAGLRYIGNGLKSGWSFVRGNKNINAAPVAEQAPVEIVVQEPTGFVAALLTEVDSVALFVVLTTNTNKLALVTRNTVSGETDFVAGNEIEANGLVYALCPETGVLTITKIDNNTVHTAIKLDQIPAESFTKTVIEALLS